MTLSDCQCGGSGYLLDQGYGEADIPDGWLPVQACDACGRFSVDDAVPDEAAARSAAADLGTEWAWIEGPTEIVADEFFHGLGDFAVRMP